jgi:hypothetical protein
LTDQVGGTWLEKHEFTGSGKKRKTTLVVLQTELSPQAFLHKVPERRRRKATSQGKESPKWWPYPTKWTSVPRKGNRSPRRLEERIITGASETMLTSPSGFVTNLPSAVDLTIRRKDAAKPCLRIKERISDQRRQERQVVLRHARDSRPPRMKTIDGHA